MSENYEDINNIITLSDEDGEQTDFELLDLIEYQGLEYVVLLPVEEESEGVIILRVDETEDEDEDDYVGIDDEDTLAAIFEIFKERFKDVYDFTD